MTASSRRRWGQAALLSDDPAFREWCYAYRAGTTVGLSEHAARQALASVWPELASWPLDDALQRMAADGGRGLPKDAAARWAIGGAARAAWELVWARYIGGGIGLLRRHQIAAMARVAMLFAERAREHGPPPPTS